MLTNEELAYIAGIVDGEGCISVIRAKRIRMNRKNGHKCVDSPRFTLVIAITNTCEPLLRWINAHYEGSIHKKTKYPNRRQCFEWILAADKAVTFLTDIRPFIRIKAAQVALGIDFQTSKIATRGRTRNKLGQVISLRTPVEELTKRDSYCVRMQMLNQQGGTWLQ